MATLLTWEPRRVRVLAAKLVAAGALAFTLAVGLQLLLGVALLPALACEPSERVRHLEVAPSPPRRHIHALTRRGATRRPALAAALSALHEVGPRTCSAASPG